MSRWQNFRIWRGRLPHWRADGVTYYVTFRHRRALDAAERADVLRSLLHADGRTMAIHIVCVLPESTELIFDMADDEAPDLSKIVEAAKRKAGKKAIRRTGEVAPPFFGESFDRIIRDEAEYAERVAAIAASPVREGLAEDAQEWDGFWSRPS